ncbi:MAG: hypothetical protein HDR36_01065 [Treponema sp.]|nr:hypothetical protein [Treponema sp.]
MKTQVCKGAVCYIDLLGFSYLTEKLDSSVLYKNPDEEKPFGEKKVKELRFCDLRNLKDYIKNGYIASENKIMESDWAYNIVDTNLKKFHEIVEKQCQPYQDAEYSVLSDSFFIIDESSDEILFIVANIFRECIKSGILVRGGLAYGTFYIVRPHMEKFNIYGAAVTKAVNYEKLGKGCRVFTDSDFPISCKAFSITNPQLFGHYKNSSDYSVLDCFEWLMIKDDYVLNPSDVDNLACFHNPANVKNAFELFYDNFEVYCNLCFSTKFAWNLKNNFGIIQIGASIEYLSALIDKTYRLSPNINIVDYQEKIEDGQNYAKNSKRSEDVVMKMIKSKIDDFRVLFGICE